MPAVLALSAVSNKVTGQCNQAKGVIKFPIHGLNGPPLGAWGAFLGKTSYIPVAVLPVVAWAERVAKEVEPRHRCRCLECPLIAEPVKELPAARLQRNHRIEGRG